MAKKNPAAVALGRLGGRKGGPARIAAMTPKELQEFTRKGGQAGGKARAESLSKKKRQDIAKKAAAARWKGKPAKKGGPKPAAQSE
jgi:general stress protein YciG